MVITQLQNNPDPTDRYQSKMATRMKAKTIQITGCVLDPSLKRPETVFDAFRKHLNMAKSIPLPEFSYQNALPTFPKKLHLIPAVRIHL